MQSGDPDCIYNRVQGLVAAAGEEENSGDDENDPKGAVVALKNIAAHNCNLTLIF